MPRAISRGGLLSREERFQIRCAIKDLQRQLDRATTPDERRRLERLIANCQHEQDNDREGRKHDKTVSRRRA